MADAFLKYKGVKGTYHYNKEMKMFVGEVQKVQNLVTFRGKNLKELERSFHNAVDKAVYKA